MSQRPIPPDPRQLFPERTRGDAPAALAALVAGVVATGAAVTNRLAFRLGYAAILGPPLLRQTLPAWLYLAAAAAALGLALWLAADGRRWAAPLLAPVVVYGVSLAHGPVYGPGRGLSWLGPLLRAPHGRRLLPEVAGWTVSSLAMTAALAFLLYRLGRSRVRVADLALGSSRPATTAELEEAGLLTGRGTCLGGWEVKGRRVPLSDDSDQHVLLLMPSGAGKTTGTILSTLLARETSAIVLDPKGELWERSAGYRASLGHRCLLFAPGSGVSLRWNCLAEVDRGSGEGGDLRTIATNLVSYPASVATQDHWIQSARSLFRLFALHALYAEEEASVPVLRTLLSRTSGGIEPLLSTLLHFPHDEGLGRGFLDRETGRPTPTHPEVALLARRFLDTPPRERGSIVSTLQSFLDIWGDDRVADASAGSDFSVRELLEPARPVSLYVVVPFEDMETLSPLLRVFLSLLFRRLTSEGAYRDAGAVPGRRRIDVFLDEFASLGRVPIVEQMLSFFRGYGLRAHLVVQDLQQIRQNYSDRESVTGNCQIHVAAATQSSVTRGHVSRLSGEATVRYERVSVSGGRTPFKKRATVAPVESRRPLLTEGEVGTVPADRVLIVKTGLPPIYAWKYPYFGDQRLAARAALPPPPVPSVPRWKVGALRTTEVLETRRSGDSGKELPSPGKSIPEEEAEG